MRRHPASLVARVTTAMFAATMVVFCNVYADEQPLRFTDPEEVEATPPPKKLGSAFERSIGLAMAFCKTTTEATAAICLNSFTIGHLMPIAMAIRSRIKGHGDLLPCAAGLNVERGLVLTMRDVFPDVLCVAKAIFARSASSSAKLPLSDKEI